MEPGNWNSSQYKKINVQLPWLLTAKQTSSKERETGAQTKPKETLCPGIFVKSRPNYQHLQYSKDVYYNKHASTYKKQNYYHPYNKTNTQRYISNEHCYRNVGNKYSLVKNSYKWINPDLNKIGQENGKKKEEDKSNTDSSYASSSSGESC